MNTYRYIDLRPVANTKRNGIATPSKITAQGSLCWLAWEHFARMYGQGVTTTTGIVEHIDARKLNKGNLRTELSNWRKFHGIE